jgi:hypothetical protein
MIKIDVKIKSDRHLEIEGVGHVSIVLLDFRLVFLVCAYTCFQ